MQPLRTDDYGTISAPPDEGPLSGLKGLLGRFTRQSVMEPGFKESVMDKDAPIDYSNIGSVIGGRLRQMVVDPVRNYADVADRGMRGEISPENVSIKDLLAMTELGMEVAGGGVTGKLAAAKLTKKGLDPNMFHAFPAQRVDAFTNTGTPKIGATLFKKVTPEEFILNRNKTKRPEFLTPYNKDDMKNWDNYLTDDGVGFSITYKKDIVGVFNNSGKRGAGQEALVDAINKGGKTLDNVGGFLDDYYSKFGFKVKEKLKWDDQYAPEGWNYEKYGRPDITLWEYPKGLSRDPSDIRKRFKSATGR